MRKTLCLLFAVTIILVGALTGCTKSSSETNPLVVCLASEPDTIDPALNSSVDGASLLIHAFEGLMNLDANGTPVYGAAESHTVSDDGTVYTFKLRKDMKWSNGDKLTAADFEYSWRRAASDELAADYGYMFEVIKGYSEGNMSVTAKDELTLEVALISPVPYFLELCAFPTYFPVHKATVEKNGDSWATDPSTYVCNGPYTMESWEHDSQIVYKKNNSYWNAKSVTP